jgi:hypothetical protein
MAGKRPFTGRDSPPPCTAAGRNGIISLRYDSPALSRDRVVPRRARLRLQELDARINPTPGALDPTFGDLGLVRLRIDGRQDNIAHDVLIQPDGKIVAAGWIGPATRSRPSGR